MPLSAWEPLIDFGLVVLIWLVQVIIYPGFKHLDSAAFAGAHKTYTFSITFFVIPLMITQLLMKGVQVVERQDGENLLSLALVLLCWVATFLLAVPCHRQLESREADPRVIQRLVRYNWIRTLCWSAVFALNLLPR